MNNKYQLCLVILCLFVAKSFAQTSQQVTAIQYFFNTDPGQGVALNGQVFNITPSISNYSIQNLSVSLSGISLNNGFNTLFVRVKDEYGRWSIPDHSFFYVNNIALSTVINKYEYFFDTDPGLGNGTIVSINAASSFRQAITIPASNTLGSGFHILYIRTQDADGRWSIPEHSLFYVSENNTTQTITALEYYFDTDPGTGNGTPYLINAGPLVNLTANITAPCLTPAGNHFVYFRAKDNYNRWSIIERDTIAVIAGIAPFTITPSGPLTLCSNKSLSLSIGNDQSFTYQWKQNGTAIPGATSSTYNVTETAIGVFSYTVTVSCGTNSTTSNAVNVNVVPPSDVFYRDYDTDSYGSSIVSLTACSQPPGYVTNNTDCNDSSAAIHTPENYFQDVDGDGFGSDITATFCLLSPPSGYSSTNIDCDDHNSLSQAPFTAYADFDGDGFGNNNLPELECYSFPSDHSLNNTDCDDTHADIWQFGNFYYDADGDGYTIGNSTTSVCYGNIIPQHYSIFSMGVDCNDANAQAWQQALLYIDGDGDGYSQNNSTVSICYGNVPYGYSLTSSGFDCDDASALIHPDATEICNGIDDDCNGLLDDNCIQSSDVPYQGGIGKGDISGKSILAYFNNVSVNAPYFGGIGKGDNLSKSTLAYFNNESANIPYSGGNGKGDNFSNSTLAYFNNESANIPYSGGTGKGDNFSNSALAYFNNGSTNSIYLGGTGKGDVSKRSSYTYLNNQSADVSFTGGNGKGDNSNRSPFIYLNNAAADVSFTGGNGKGDNCNRSPFIYLNNASADVSFTGGIGKGDNSNRSSYIYLNNASADVSFTGGNGNGDNSNRSLFIYLNNASADVSFTGGNGNGDNSNRSPFIYLNNASADVSFTGGNGKGDNSNRSPFIYLNNTSADVSFSGGNGKGDNSNRSPFIYLNNTSADVSFSGGNGKGDNSNRSPFIYLNNASADVSFSGGNGKGDNSNRTRLLNLNGNCQAAIPFITTDGSSDLCLTGSVILTTNNPTGDNYSSFLWTNGITESGIIIKNNGSYAVTVTDANGCTAASNPIYISGTATFYPVISASEPAIPCAGDVILSTNYNNGIALSFDGIDDYIHIPSNALLSVNDFTLEYWIKTEVQPAFDRITSTDGDAFEIATNGNDIEVLGLGNGWTSVASITPGEWTHLAFVRNGTSFAVYKNGINSFTSVCNLTTLPSSWQIGQKSNSGGNYSKMTLAEFRIWNFARTQSDIESTMSSSVIVNSIGLTLYYQLNEGSDNIALDATSNDNNGILVNNPTWIILPASLVGAAAYSYLWSNNETSSVIRPNTSGFYSVLVTNSNGCSGTSGTSEVNVLSVPDAPLISTSIPVPCINNYVTVALHPNNSYSSYQWSTGETTLQITIATGSNYNVTVSNAIGCTTTIPLATALLTIPPTWYYDADMDGFGSETAISNANCIPAGFAASNDDCNDLNSAVNPAATEICFNNIDDNCDGYVDEGCTLTLNLRAFIQGFYLGGNSMQSPMNASGISSNPLECDTILIELHDAMNPAAIIGRKIVVLDINGYAVSDFPPAMIGASVYIVVKHRNSIETWSKDPVTLSTNTNYDFTH